MEENRLLKFELSPKDIKIKKILNKEFLELDIYAISNIYPNRNESAFTEESMIKSKDTCYNKPILGSFDTFTNDFKEHNGEDKYDADYENYYWDTSSGSAEKPLGLIRESDKVEVVDHNGLKWLKISCALWTMYSYRQVKRLLKSPTKKVSVEILVKKSHFDDDKIQVIDEFVLTGITILGDNVAEGIPGAHLNILDLMATKDYSKQVQCLSFAYDKRDGIQTDINPDNTGTDIKTTKMEVRHMTYGEKLAFLTSKLAEVLGDDDHCRFWMCDFSDEFVIVNDYEAGKYFKIPYAVNTNEDSIDVSFDLEGKVEQVPTFKDAAREFIAIGEEQKNIDEIYEMYTQSVENYNTLNEEFNSYKSEAESKVYSIEIDGVEYNVESLNEKFIADMAAKQEECDTKAEECKNACEERDAAKDELCDLKAKVAEAEADKLCGDGMALADEEDELDDDDRDAIKEKCSKHEYSSISEVEDDIARALYQKKKNNRSKNFKSGIPTPAKVDDDAISVFDKI